MMQTAALWSTKSYCKRNRVGAVLEKDGRVLVTGYNGTLSGAENDCEEDGITKANVVHAEQNIIAFAAKHGVATSGCTMYTTLSPCEECAKLIVQAGITRVIYADEYRNINGLNILAQHGVMVTKYE